MNSKHVLIPLNLVRGTADPLVFAQQLALERPLLITLLHVVDLNIAPALRVYSQLCAESEAALRKLAKLFFGSDQAVRVVVRVGRTADEILAEAEAAAADMIVLSHPVCSKGLRLFRGATTRAVLRRASCPTVVLPHPEKDAPQCLRLRQRVSSEAWAVASIEETSAAA